MPAAVVTIYKYVASQLRGMFSDLHSMIEGQGPTLSTLIEIGRIVEEAQDEAPLSLAEIGRRMEAKRTRHETIRTCVDFLESLGFVVAGSKGVQWTYVPPEDAEVTLRKAAPLLPLEPEPQTKNAWAFPRDPSLDLAREKFSQEQSEIRATFPRYHEELHGIITAIQGGAMSNDVLPKIRSWAVSVLPSIPAAKAFDGAPRFSSNQSNLIGTLLKKAAECVEKGDAPAAILPLMQAQDILHWALESELQRSRDKFHEVMEQALSWEHFSPR